MVYNAPLDENKKPYFVPVVTKNKDVLIGHLSGVNTSKEIFSDILESLKIKMDMKSMNAILDSTRFNDILQDGRRESEMTTDELKEYLLGVVGEMTEKIIHEDERHKVKTKNILELECSCDIGYYAWENYDDIPEVQFRCSNCGKVLIDYTGVYDHEIEYDYNEG